MPNQNHLIDVNIAGLQEGHRLLSMLSPKQYVQGFKPAFQSDIGTHFRHILEHYRCFFEQLEESEFRYDLRLRDARLESEIEYAKSTIAEVIAQLRELNSALFEKEYTIGEAYTEFEDKSSTISGVRTTLARELMFLQSHTVHHFAMIAAMSRSLGIQPDEEFGVAIPTRNYARQLDQVDSSRLKKVNS